MLTIRERRPDDLPALAAVMAEQQPASRYPMRWPLPFPTEDFIARPGELVALVAELDGVVVGHVSALRVAHVAQTPTVDAEFVTAWSAGHGLPPEGLATVSALFTATSVRGQGMGVRLLDAAVAAIRAEGLGPCLDVFVPTPAAQMYRARGWIGVGRFVPGWLPADPAARGGIEALEGMILR